MQAKFTKTLEKYRTIQVSFLSSTSISYPLRKFLLISPNIKHYIDFLPFAFLPSTDIQKNEKFYPRIFLPLLILF